MSLTITGPEATVNGMLTKALASRSQILYTFQREDDEIINGLEGPNRVVIAGDFTSFYVPGSSIYVGFDTDPDNLSGLYAVTSSAFVTPNTEIRIDDLGSVAVPDAGYINLLNKDNYRLEVDIFNATNDKSILGAALTFIPNQAGFMDIDIGRIIYSYISRGSTFLFSLEFYITVNEVFTGSSETPTQTTTLQATQAFEQLLHPGGALMPENLLRLFGTATDDSLGKLLTTFENPIMWRGWNRTIGALIDQEYPNRVDALDFFFVEQEADINKDPTSASVPVAQTQTVGISIYMLTVDTGAFNRVWVAGNAGAQISDVISFKVEDECENPVMLDWLNSDGNPEQWLFQIDQSILSNSGEGIYVETPISTNIENIKTTKRRYPGAFVQRMTLAADNLTVDQLLGLQELKQTESLRVYLSKDGVNFIDAVVVEDFGSEYSTQSKGYSFSVSIEFPDGFRFEKGKLY